MIDRLVINNEAIKLSHEKKILTPPIPTTASPAPTYVRIRAPVEVRMYAQRLKEIS
jgi:hypothetical protein